MLVVGFFTGDVVEPFDHKVITAYKWPIDELVQRLSQAGFTEIERAHRLADDNQRSHGALVAR